MRRLILLVLAAAVACEMSESPTEPSRDSLSVQPSFSFTGGSGKVLASTNEGELIEIDLDAGTATLIGDVGIVGGDELGWTDIAADDAGHLFALSRVFTESEFEAHLYEIDPMTGSVLTDIGSAGDHQLSDFDFDGTTFYGSGLDYFSDCCGRLFTIDATDAQVTWVNDTLGFGTNVYDSVFEAGPIGSGGFAVHPVTGALWGVEALHSQAPVLYRIDRATGVADSILRLGMGGVPVPQQVGFDGLHILNDGTFIASRGGAQTSEDSLLWEISSVVDPLTGLAEIAPIPLTMDTLIEGGLNGLAGMPLGATPTHLDLSCTLTVTRGEVADCQITNPLSEVEGLEFSWSFAPLLVPYTPGSQEYFTNRVVNRGPPESTSEWTGQVVHPGKVIVDGLRNGQIAARSDEVTINVTDRSWLQVGVFLDPASHNAAQIEMPLPTPSTSLKAGRNHSSPYTPGGDRLSTFFSGTHSLAQVADGGPNDGYVYVSQATYFLNRAYSLNVWIEQTPGYPYYLGGLPNTTTWNYVQSRGLNPNIVRNNTINHEVGSASNSHQSRLAEAGSDFPSCGNLNVVLERLTASSVSDINQEIDLAKQNAYAAAKWASGHKFVYGFQTTDAVVASWINPPGVLFLLPKSPDPDNDGYQPPPPTRCDVSGL